MTDDVLCAIADYACDPRPPRPAALDAARLALRDALACAFLALREPSCAYLVGPLVPGATMPGGARVPGTSFELDPVRAAFSLGVLVRWLDFNDTWLAAEWGHPSDNLGALLATADWLARLARMEGRAPPTMRDLLASLVRAYEIQGVLGLGNSLNAAGLDHVTLVRVASAATCAALLGCDRVSVAAAVSHAWLDGASLRTYRQAAGAGPRKGWAAADAAARGVQLALLARSGEPGCPGVLTAPVWGFPDALLHGAPVRLVQGLGSHVIENVLYKVSHPAEYHAQSAVEAALALHAQVTARCGEVERVVIETHAAALRIIDRPGPLANRADRDHCLQYMVAVPLIFGRLGSADYADELAADARIDALRARMELRENPVFTASYHAPAQRWVPNALQVFFRDGTATPRVEVLAPLGHPLRRREALAPLAAKFESSVTALFAPRQSKAVLGMFDDPSRLEALPVNDFVATLVSN
jgi:2-methylcitrate dehydratase